MCALLMQLGKWPNENVCEERGCDASSGGTSNRKLELSVAGASDPSARVQKSIARKLRADNI